MGYRLQNVLDLNHEAIHVDYEMKSSKIKELEAKIELQEKQLAKNSAKAEPRERKLVEFVGKVKVLTTDLVTAQAHINKLEDDLSNEKAKFEVARKGMQLYYYSEVQLTKAKYHRLGFQ